MNYSVIHGEFLALKKGVKTMTKEQKIIKKKKGLFV